MRRKAYRVIGLMSNPKTLNLSTTPLITHRPLSSSFWGLPYRSLNINCKP